MRIFRLWAGLAAAGLFTTPGAQASSFGPGEQLVLRVDYSGIKAGTAVITVGSPTKVGTAETLPIVTVADTEALFSVYPLHDKFVSWWSPDQGRGVAYDFSANENGKVRRERAKLGSPGPGKVQVQRVHEGAPPSLSAYDIDPTAQDIASAFYTLRTKPLTPGDVITLPVFTGNRTWNLTARVNAPEPLEVGAGKFDALPMDVEVHFQGKLESKRNLKVWVSNDPRHVLLKLQADLALGALYGELVEYHQGNDVAQK